MMGSFSSSFAPLLICQVPCGYPSVCLFSALQSSYSFCLYFIEYQVFSVLECSCPITLESCFALIYSNSESCLCSHLFHSSSFGQCFVVQAFLGLAISFHNDIIFWIVIVYTSYQWFLPSSFQRWSYILYFEYLPNNWALPPHCFISVACHFQ